MFWRSRHSHLDRRFYLAGVGVVFATVVIGTLFIGLIYLFRHFPIDSWLQRQSSAVGVTPDPAVTSDAVVEAYREKLGVLHDRVAASVVSSFAMIVADAEATLLRMRVPVAMLDRHFQAFLQIRAAQKLPPTEASRLSLLKVLDSLLLL